MALASSYILDTRSKKSMRVLTHSTFTLNSARIGWHHT